jgi:transcriptional regulator with XRE-family HTH domain
MMREKADFGLALKSIRHARKLTQEDFSLISSRTYISALERGLKNPSLDKIEKIAKTLQVSPLTLLVLAYCDEVDTRSALSIIEHLKKDLEELKFI